jgi:ABC-2 type transport system ATP-binding protein
MMSYSRGMMDDAVRIQNLEKSFRGHLSIGLHKVLRGVNLTVPTGVIYGFLGPNGAGKTTTLKVLTGLLFADKGEISIFGKPPQDLPTKERVGFLPETPYFYDYLTGMELLLFMGRLFGLPTPELRARANELLSTVGLHGKGKVQLRKYSKGMLQRIGLAQALMNEPDLVILDEPMSGLDPIGRREIRDLILGLKDAGKTIFFSSHILADAEMICDQVAIIVKGQVVREGPLETLLGTEVHFWEVTVRGTGALTLPPACTLLARQGSQLLLRVDGESALQEILDLACHEGANVRSVVPQKVSLEDLFLAQIPGERT